VKRAIPGLLLALLIQLLLVMIVYRGELMPRQPATSPELSVLDPNQIDALNIHDGDGTRARLSKAGGRWRLPALHGLPADPEKVDKLLKALLATGNDWPVASSTAARQRFKVAEYRFRRRIEFFAGGEKRQAIYLGTSPGFRKVHARVAGQDEIRSVAFNVHDAPASDSAWIDPRLLQVRTPVRIDADAYTVQREGDEWRSGTGDVPDQRELLALLSALRSLQVEGVADTATVTDLTDLEAELVLDIHSLAGRIELSLFQLAGRHFIRSSEYPVIFRISAYDFERITGIDFLLMSGKGDDGDRP
jgi:hypothetical protein